MLIFQVLGSWAHKETTAVPPTPSSYSWVWAQVKLSSSSFVLPSLKKITKTFFWANIRNLLQVQGGKAEPLQHRNWLWASDTTKIINDNQIHREYRNTLPSRSVINIHCALVQEQQAETRIFDLVLETCLLVNAKQLQFGQNLGSVNGEQFQSRTQSLVRLQY